MDAENKTQVALLVVYNISPKHKTLLESITFSVFRGIDEGSTGCPSSTFHSLRAYITKSKHVGSLDGKANMCLKFVHFI